MLLRIEEVAALENLARAYRRAALGKRDRAEVRAFSRNWLGELRALRCELLRGEPRLGTFRRFRIWDPKPRLIEAPPFRDRVLHHALMAHLGPPLERSLVDDTFACRVGRGPLEAARRARRHLQRWPWYVKIDVRRYFSSIDHAVLLGLLGRRIKGPAVLELCRRILEHGSPSGRGLPIGALTSQHFANLYLAPLDRFLLQELRVGGMVRYMDDVAWWVGGRAEARRSLAAAADFAAGRLRLELKSPSQIQRSARGVGLCGFRIHRGTIRLSRRRRTRYRRARSLWEGRWLRGEIGPRELQRGYAAAVAITGGAEAQAWRREELRARQPPDV